jgi:2-polyprenyl-3-methyl-5-hydroxy-6-metoxy-1,4-benzoquinol methylase
MSAEDVIAAWDKPGAVGAIHPTRGISEDAYWASGRAQAELLQQDIPAGAKVLDFGCGDGRVAIPLRGMGYDVTGADASATMLAALAANDPGLKTVQSDGTNLDKRRKYDAVYCLAVLIHHSYDTGEQLLANLRGVVKKHGLLILDWPVSPDPVEAATWINVTTWSQDRQDALVEKLGLTRIDEGQPWQVFRA